MADDEEEGRGGDGGFWPAWLTPKRAVEFLKSIIQLERSVDELKEDNRSLRVQINKLQLQVAEMNGKVETLVDFVSDSISRPKV